jgi:hypothetical protein
MTYFLGIMDSSRNFPFIHASSFVISLRLIDFERGSKHFSKKFYQIFIEWTSTLIKSIKCQLMTTHYVSPSSKLEMSKEPNYIMIRQ